MIISVYWIMKELRKKIEHEVEKDVALDSKELKLLKQILKILNNMATKG